MGDRYFDPALGQSTCPHDPLINQSAHTGGNRLGYIGNDARQVCIES